MNTMINEGATFSLPCSV